MSDDVLMSWDPGDRLSRHFRVRELDPENAARGEERERLLRLARGTLDVIRDAVGVPVSVTRSGGFHPPEFYQSRRWPARSNGSQHRKARAADIVAGGWDHIALANKVGELVRAGELPDVGGIGCYRYADGAGFVHVDIRPAKRLRLALWRAGVARLHRADVRWSRGA